MVGGLVGEWVWAYDVPGRLGSVVASFGAMPSLSVSVGYFGHARISSARRVRELVFWAESVPRKGLIKCRAETKPQPQAATEETIKGRRENLGEGQTARLGRGAAVRCRLREVQVQVLCDACTRLHKLVEGWALVREATVQMWQTYRQHRRSGRAGAMISAKGGQRDDSGRRAPGRDAGSTA